LQSKKLYQYPQTTRSQSAFDFCLGSANCEIKDEQAKEPWREDKGLMEFLKATCAAMMIGLSCAGRVSLP